MPTDNQSPKYKSHPTSSYTVPKYNHILKRQVMKKNAVCLISKHSTMIKKYFYVKLYFSVCECTCYKTISVLIFLTCCRFINIIKKWHYIKRYALFNFYFNRYINPWNEWMVFSLIYTLDINYFGLGDGHYCWFIRFCLFYIFWLIMIFTKTATKKLKGGGENYVQCIDWYATCSKAITFSQKITCSPR